MTKHQLWIKATTQANRYEDLITCCEDKTELPYLVKELKYWKAKSDKALDKLIK